MRIGIDARPLSREITGIGMYVCEIIKNLNQIDTHNQYILYSNRDIHIDFELRNNWTIKVHKFPIGNLWLNLIMPFCIKRDKIDVFWGTSHILPLFGSSCPLVLTVHDLALLKYPVGTAYTSFIQKTLLKPSCKKADKIIPISNSTKEDLIELLGINTEKIQVIYPGISTDLYPFKDQNKSKHILLEKYKINDKFILYLGTIEPRKNIPTIIRAFKKAKENMSFDCKLVIAGGLGWKYKEVFELIEKLELSEFIIYTGYIDLSDKIHFYNACEFFVFPSIYEGFGIPLLEAMCCGKPTISTNISSMPEVVGDAGLLIDRHDDFEQLARLFHELYFDQELKRSLSAKALLQSRKFSYEGCARRTLDVFGDTYNKRMSKKR